MGELWITLLCGKDACSWGMRWSVYGVWRLVEYLTSSWQEILVIRWSSFDWSCAWKRTGKNWTFSWLLIALGDSAPGNLHAFDSKRHDEICESSPCKSFFRKSSQKVFKLLCPILSMCVPFPGRLYCSPPLLAEDWGASEHVRILVSYTNCFLLCGQCVGIPRIRHLLKVPLLQMDLHILGFPFKSFKNAISFAICV